jgi:hypothetical protein
VVVVEVAVDMDTIRTSTVIVSMSMISAVVMAMAAMIVRTMVVAMTMVADILRETIRIMAAAPMKLVKYVARLGILR